MRVAHEAHLTYCTNIHAGEAWTEVRSALEQHLPRVKERVSPAQPFGVGLRLSAAATAELVDAEVRSAFQHWLREHGLYVFTLNVFPYGRFHGAPVKQGVYAPDWSTPERLAYTCQAADVLAALLPTGVEGSLSTVPGTFRPLADGARRAAMVHNLVQFAAHLVQVERSTGRRLCLALEPEPHCMLQTCREGLEFIRDQLWSPAARTQLAAASGVDRTDAERLLQRHLGLCLDACHAAVEFEDVADEVRALRAAGVRIAKWQISSGLKLVQPQAPQLEVLEHFAEDVYLHQTVVRSASGLHHYLDLAQALAEAPRGAGTEWRVHFHVPIFREQLGPFSGSQDTLCTLLNLHREQAISAHLEVETYTWDVLPEEHRQLDVDDAIARELRWVLERL